MSNSNTKICKADGCGNGGHYDKKRSNYYLSLGYCDKHYRRLKRHGSVDIPTRSDSRPAIIDGSIARIQLGINAKHGYAIVDIDKADLSDEKWVISNNGYVYNGKVLLHHLVIGKPPKGKVVDHINRNKLDNRSSNLRFTTQKNNSYNRGKRSNNTTGFVGVSRIRSRINPYQASYSITLDGKKRNYHIGCYPTPEMAARARDDVVMKLHGKYAYLNFPV